MQSKSYFLACRRLSTSVLTPGSDGGEFPSDLLTKKQVITTEHTQGMWYLRYDILSFSAAQGAGYSC